MLNSIRRHYQSLGSYTIPITILYLIFAGRFISCLITDTYDWDIDHEIYFSQRLLNGELIYIKEFQDKMPVNQYIYIIPAFLKSIKSWVLINTSITIYACICLQKIIKRIILNDWKIIESTVANRISIFCAVFYGSTISSVWGSLYHTNLFASNMCIFAIYYLLNDNNEYSINYVKSLLFSSLAICLRPYYVMPMLLLIIWTRSREVYFHGKYTYFNIYDQIKDIIFHFFIWVGSLALLIGITNASPYLFTNNIDKFFKAIIFNSYDLRPFVTPSTVLQYQFNGITKFGNIESFIYFSFIIPIIFIIFNQLKSRKIIFPGLNKAYVDIVFISLISPVLLEYTILTRHFYDHYHQFFILFSSLSLAFSLVLMYPLYLNKIKLNVVNRNFLNRLILVLLCIFISRTEISKIGYYLIQSKSVHSQEAKLEYIKTFLSSRKANQKPIDFLDTQGIYSHWKLNESRHGFPSPSLFNDIYLNKWSIIQPPPNTFPNTRTRLCKKMREEGPSIIFIEQNTEGAECLEKYKGEYDINYLGIIKDNIGFYAYTKK